VSELTAEIRLELRDLVERYAVCADARDRAGFGAVFAPDGCLVVPGGHRCEGREAIVANLDHLDAHYPKSMHFVGNHIVTLVDADLAEGTVYCLAHHVYETEGVGRDTLMMIRYYDRYRRRSGSWQIEERRLDIDWQEDRPLSVA